jgi:hypothetical protein
MTDPSEVSSSNFDRGIGPDRSQSVLGKNFSTGRNISTGDKVVFCGRIFSTKIFLSRTDPSRSQVKFFLPVETFRPGTKCTSAIEFFR